MPILKLLGPYAVLKAAWNNVTNLATDSVWNCFAVPAPLGNLRQSQRPIIQRQQLRFCILAASVILEELGIDLIERAGCSAAKPQPTKTST
jgi:hypothetical protein